MKLLILILALSSTFAFAGEMKKIDYATRVAVADAYYVGEYDENYDNFLYSEIMNVSFDSSEDPTFASCLVVVTGIATKMTEADMPMYKFWVCINRDGEGDYLGKLIKDIKVATY